MARIGSRNPVFVPVDVMGVLDKLSKNDLMDLVWTFAGQTTESAEDEDLVRDAIATEVNIHAEQKPGMRVPAEMGDWLRNEDEEG